jgi:PIN domain nuclease of toxin-antitoxin system
VRAGLTTSLEEGTVPAARAALTCPPNLIARWCPHHRVSIELPRVVADTHTVLWYLYNDSRLSSTAGALLDQIDAVGDQIAMSSMVLAEVIYLIEKGRIATDAFDHILAALNRVDATLVKIPLDRLVVQAMRQIDRAHVPELPDRIVAATALHLGVPMISRDRKIKSSIVPTIWA